MAVRIEAITGKRIVVLKNVAAALKLPIPRKRLPAKFWAETLVNTLWFEKTLFPGWTLALRLLGQQGRIVVAEARVFPAEADRSDPGEWSGCLLGHRATVPEGGLTTTIVRKAKLGTISNHIKQIVSAITERPEQAPRDIDDLLERAKQNGVVPKIASDSDLLNSTLLEGDTVEDHYTFGKEGTLGSFGIPSPHTKMKAGSKRGPKPTKDRIYLQVAAYYVKKLKKRSLKPSKDVAEKFGFTEAVAKSMVRESRRRGFLTPAVHGKRGGELTPLAKSLLG